MNYITATVRPATAFHGYKEDGKPVVYDVARSDFVEKVIKLDRILSFIDEYIFIECPHNTVETWEYKGNLAEIKVKLRESGALISG